MRWLPLGASPAKFGHTMLTEPVSWRVSWRVSRRGVGYRNASIVPELRAFKVFGRTVYPLDLTKLSNLLVMRVTVVCQSDRRLSLGNSYARVKMEPTSCKGSGGSTMRLDGLGPTAAGRDKTGRTLSKKSFREVD